MTFSPQIASPTRRRRVLLAQAWWQDRVLRGVAAYASTHDWELQCRMHWTRQLPVTYEWQGDGILAMVGVSKWLRRASRPLIGFVRKAGVPVVEMQAFVSYFSAPKVVVAHDAIGRMAAEHLLGLNFRHLGYVTFDDNPLEEHKRVAYQQAVAAAGRQFYAFTPRSLKRTIAEMPRPMALLAMNDPNAFEVIQICRDAGFRVPEEFAVMGVDDTDILCDLATVPLTSINCDLERQGYEAAALLDRLMDGQRPPREPILIPPKGVSVRRSTDTIAIPDIATANMLRAIRDRFREPCSIQQIANELGVPLRRMNSPFREHVGRTMLQELTRLRVEYARKLLGNRKLKLERIASESGFSSRFHFTQAFRRVTGVTPKAYRRAGEPRAVSATDALHLFR